MTVNKKKMFIIVLTEDLRFRYSIFDCRNHIPSIFYRLQNGIQKYSMETSFQIHFSLINKPFLSKTFFVLLFLQIARYNIIPTISIFSSLLGLFRNLPVIKDSTYYYSYTENDIVVFNHLFDKERYSRSIAFRSFIEKKKNGSRIVYWISHVFLRI